MTHDITRRDFVKLTASAGAAISLGGLYGCERGSEPVRTVAMVNDAAINRFAEGFKGELIHPDDTAYDAARRVWNARYDKHPGMIARCGGVEDVVRAVDFARNQNLVAAVRAGGHSSAGHSVCDGGVVIDLSGMRTLSMDPRRRIVHAEPGLRVGEVDQATQGAGLATVLAECPSVGLGGFTTGGGAGVLMGKYGLGCDNVLSAEVVLADGSVVTASPESDPDLYWAIRGGGGNFGIVTSFEYRLHPVTEVLAGPLVWDVSQGANVLKFYREFAASAPDQLTTSARFVALPTGPAFIIMTCYPGDISSGEEVLRPLRNFGNPVADMVAPMPYIQSQSMGGAPAGASSASRSGYIAALSDETIDSLQEFVNEAPPGFVIALTHLHGAVTSMQSDATAFPMREPGFDLWLLAAWQDPDQAEAAEGWIGRVRAAAADPAGMGYVNAMDSVPQERVRAAYGANYGRLAQLKRRYDPDNFFRLNQNVIPA
jgi:FAD/FMN-containing dehydrogenase